MITRRINTYMKDMKLWQHCDYRCRAAFTRAMRGADYGKEELRDAFVWFDEGWKAADIARLNDTCSQINTDPLPQTMNPLYL